MEDFVNFKLAQKLKEKGFDCKYPFAMYDEDGDSYPLFTSCDEDEDSKCIFGKRMYYGYDDFVGDKDAVIAPIISQVLKWLREEKKIHITANMYQDESEDADGRIVDKWCFWNWDIQSCISGNFLQDGDDAEYESYESATLAGIEYAINNLI